MSRRVVIPLVIVAAAIGALALLIYGVASRPDTASIDSKVASGHYPLAPRYDRPLPLLGSSRTESLAAFRGRVVLMNVYASWCDACQTEARTLAHEQRVLAAHGGTVVGVTYKDDADSTMQFDRRYGLRFPVLRDPSGSFVQQFGTDYVPESFVLSPTGRILAVSRDPVSQSWLNQVLTPILARRA